MQNPHAPMQPSTSLLLLEQKLYARQTPASKTLLIAAVCYIVWIVHGHQPRAPTFGPQLLVRNGFCCQTCSNAACARAPAAARHTCKLNAACDHVHANKLRCVPRLVQCCSSPTWATAAFRTCTRPTQLHTQRISSTRPKNTEGQQKLQSALTAAAAAHQLQHTYGIQLLQHNCPVLADSHNSSTAAATVRRCTASTS